MKVYSDLKRACYKSYVTLRWKTELLRKDARARARAEKCPRRGGVLPHMGYIGMCGPKGYGFSAVLVINRVSSRPPSPIRALPSSSKSGKIKPATKDLPLMI